MKGVKGLMKDIEGLMKNKEEGDQRGVRGGVQ